MSSSVKPITFIGAVMLFAFAFYYFIFFFPLQIAILPSDESLLSAAPSRCCSSPFSSSVAYGLIFLSSMLRWGKNRVQFKSGLHQIEHAP